MCAAAVSVNFYESASKNGRTPALAYNVRAKANGGSKQTGAKRKPGRPAKAEATPSRKVTA